MKMSKKHMESRMLGNLHVRFGVGVEVELLGLHHLVKGSRKAPWAGKTSPAS
jgi:hypothetical protein